MAGLGGAQFAAPAAVELLRSMREMPDAPRTHVLAATDPANPYGAIVRWPQNAPPDDETAGRGPTRSAGARVVLVDGELAGYLRRGERELLLFSSDAEPRHAQVTREVARALRRLMGTRGMLLAEIDGSDATAHPAAAVFIDEGFARTAMGLQLRPEARGLGPADGIAVAETASGGDAMADEPRTTDDLVDTPGPDETRETEQERVRSSNDRDQARERAGQTPPHARGYDEAVRGESVEDIDPDSAASDVDRDDSGVE